MKSKSGWNFLDSDHKYGYEKMLTQRPNLSLVQKKKKKTQSQTTTDSDKVRGYDSLELQEIFPVT